MSTETITPDAPDLAAYAATTAVLRADASLAHLAADRIAFAKGDPDLIVGLAVCKPGVFNGVFEVTRDDLDAWVARFEALRGVFRPPLRLDHGWSVTEVVGRFEALRVENRTDEAAGGTVVPMLVGDVRLVGTPADRKLIREWIIGDKLNERSSEFWPYRTNTGAEYPSVFAGCAFVDIPAVEGLGAITLRRATLAHDTTHPEGTSMSDTTVEPTEGDVDVVEPTTDEPTTPTEDDETEVTEGIVIEDADDDGDHNAPEGDGVDEDEDEQPVGEVPADLAAALAGAGITLDRRLLAAIDTEVERRATLAREADERILKFRTKGVLTPGVAPAATRLLRHADKEVRDDIAAVLEATVAPVKLGHEAGTLATKVPSEDGTTSPDELRELSATEIGPAWAALTYEQRKSPEYLAAYRQVTGTDNAAGR